MTGITILRFSEDAIIGRRVLDFWRSSTLSKLEIFDIRSSITRRYTLRYFIVLGAVALAVCAFDSKPAHADELDVVLAVPRAVVNDGLGSVVPIIDLSQTIPSGNDVRALPNPSDEPLIQYPIRVLRYGLNLYPTSRILRQNGFPSL